MANTIYQDIACRTGGDIYIGVVGPVRSEKSTWNSWSFPTFPTKHGGNVPPTNSPSPPPAERS